MAIPFYKYQGTGNDFVLIDNRDLHFNKNNTDLVKLLCDRKFGIGADGLILLEPDAEAHFKMVYYNADGRESSMCGNGGRCIVHFARFLGIVEDEATFTAIDGWHEATIEGDIVSLKMTNVEGLTEKEDSIFLDTGSPHHVTQVEGLKDYNVFSEGRSIRNDVYGEAGANVNFVEPLAKNTFSVRTYERGVEDETLSCGTGVTAVAIAMHAWGKAGEAVTIETPGGTLEVSFEKQNGHYENIWLKGPAKQVFKGSWE
ncbi:diaminopimelate epimerase [Aureisphaera galaxeae]|uniref:diaminopimelate epimerase n=1 Tax=Aureisphaera galaxeae TaxID=1538023 RepID=UPI002350E41E|nr:diaminopimelate epimerase [Aureisphaera galaxeae]MDC8004992.1 diaminopimelate epimerase [Aureisphaera galaxeae]